MFVQEINTNRGFNIGAQIGTFLPIRSATGKVFMAFMDEQIIHDWKANEFKQIPKELVSMKF